MCLEDLEKVTVVDTVGQIAHVQLLAHERASRWNRIDGSRRIPPLGRRRSAKRVTQNWSLGWGGKEWHTRGHAHGLVHGTLDPSECIVHALSFREQSDLR